MSATDTNSLEPALVVMASRLDSGRTVFQCADGSWSTSIDAALVETDQVRADRALERAISEQTEVLDAYLVCVDAAARPLLLREAIRVTGPTVLPSPVQLKTAKSNTGQATASISGAN